MSDLHYGTLENILDATSSVSSEVRFSRQQIMLSVMNGPRSVQINFRIWILARVNEQHLYAWNDKFRIVDLYAQTEWFVFRKIGINVNKHSYYKNMRCGTLQLLLDFFLSLRAGFLCVWTFEQPVQPEIKKNGIITTELQLIIYALLLQAYT